MLLSYDDLAENRLGKNKTNNQWKRWKKTYPESRHWPYPGPCPSGRPPRQRRRWQSSSAGRDSSEIRKATGFGSVWHFSCRVFSGIKNDFESFSTTRIESFAVLRIVEVVSDDDQQERGKRDGCRVKDWAAQRHSSAVYVKEMVKCE